MSDGSKSGINLEDLIELDEQAPPKSNAERCRQQSAFHAREVADLTEAIQAARAGVASDEWPKDPRLAECHQHQQLEMTCRELAASFDWLVSKARPSTDLPRAMEEVRANYDRSPEIVLLREIAETGYPLLNTITRSRQNGVGLISETVLTFKHAARGQPLADTLDTDEAETLLDAWLARAISIKDRPTVYIPMVQQAVDWMVLLSRQRAPSVSGRVLEDDLEMLIYLARQTLDEAEFFYREQEMP